MSPVYPAETGGSSSSSIIQVFSDRSEPSSLSTVPPTTAKRPSGTLHPVGISICYSAKLDIVSPREYVEAINFHSKETIQDTLYPGSIFEDLGLYLRTGLQNIRPSNNIQGTLHTVHKLGGRSLDLYSDPLECALKLEEGKKSMDCQILFLHGYPSPKWISTIGALCRTDPQYFNTHLRFQCRRDYYSFPTLLSDLENIITLRFVTLGSREQRFGKCDQARVDALRQDGERDMARYEHDLLLGSGLEAGDSIVRSFSVLDEKNFILEQEMSIYLHKYEEGWISTSPVG